MVYAAGFPVNMTIVWLVAMVVLLVVEGLAPGLVSIWFAIGALAALISSLLGAPLWLQVIWFLAVSIIALCFTRPLAKKYVNSRVQPTNADAVIGRECVVTERIDNLKSTGAVSVSGRIWTARMERDDEVAEEGSVVRAVRIEGVKLIVK
ncbi:MAG: NfeD family protein [Candidatus Limivicinus sp.]|jgi:membrane protein implicated in regulation of membrane protease activity